MPRPFPLYLAVACLVLFLCGAAPVFAADPVEVAVTGVEGDPLENVRQALALPHGLVRDGKVDRLWLDRFATQAPQKVRQALEPFGYYKSEVSAKVVQTRDGAHRLQVAVLPGEPVRVVDVDLELTGGGAEEKTLLKLVESFPLTKGEVLLHPEYEQGKGALQSQAQTLGYLDADFTRSEIRISADLATARIALTLETGPRYYFAGARIEGAPEYPPEYLARFVAFKEGEPFSYAKLGETQLNFANSERFRQVVITPQREQAKDARVPVLVRVTAAPRRTLRTGAGYGTDTGARLSVRYRDLNLFHKGHDLDLSIYAAQRLQGFAGRYTVPSETDHRSSTSLQLNLQQEDVTSYRSKIAALELDRTIGLGRGELATVYLRLMQENFTIADVSANSRLVLPGFRFSKDSFNDMVRPTRGYRYSTDGVLDDPLGELPPSIRFFAGGDQSVRGYAYQSLGPRDQTGKVIGGKHLLVGSLELERALYKNWGVSVFHDLGNAFNEYENMHLEQGAGIGVHYYTPVGGLNLYLAKPFAPGSPSYRIHFTVGFQL